MLWTEALKPSEVTYMNDIIAQVPEGGARDAFVNILQGLADKARPPTWKFYIMNSDGEISGGSNDSDVASHFECTDDYSVIDVEKNEWDTMKVREIFVPDGSDDDQDD